MTISDNNVIYGIRLVLYSYIYIGKNNRLLVCFILMASFGFVIIFLFVVTGNPCPPENVEPGSGVCYYVAGSILYEYADAKTACSNINMRIAVINTATKQTFIENLGILDDAGKWVYLHLAMVVCNLDQLLTYFSSRILLKKSRNILYKFRCVNLKL